MVNLGGRIFVLGGGDGMNYVKDVEEFDVQTFILTMIFFSQI